MLNYSTKNQIPVYFICFLVHGDGTEWIDADLPTPNLFKKFEHSYLIGWQIDGYFATKKGQEYLNDIIARIIFTLPVKERLKYRPNNPLQIDRIYKLKAFQELKSLPNKFAGYANLQPDLGLDRVFWAIKWKVEQIIEEQGEGKIVPYELIENWAKVNFIDDVKDKSTLRAKCRSIWNWYDKRNWTIPERRKSEMSRSEHIKQVHEKRREDSRRKILNLITGLYADDYKTKTGKWNISKIAKELGMGRDTVRKYLKEL
jgi:hypothetical protein